MLSSSLSLLLKKPPLGARSGAAVVKTLTTAGARRQLFCASYGVLGHSSLSSADTTLPPSFTMVFKTGDGSIHQQRPPRTTHQVRLLGSALPQMDDEDASHPLSVNTKPTPFLLADIGEGIAEVELMQWFVQQGDHVQQFDRICEVQSDKATVEITSRYDGTILSLDHAVGDMVKVGEALMHIAAEHDEHDDLHDSAVPASASTQTEATMGVPPEEQLHIPTIASKFHFDSDDDEPQAPAMEQQATTVSNTYHDNSKVLTSPAIRKLAKEHNLDLATIVGTGPKGRVSKGDVLTVLKERGLVAPEPTAVATAEPKATTATTPETSAPSTAPVSSTQSSPNSDLELPLQQDTVVPLRGYNRLMVSAMTASLQIPHMVYSDEFNLNKFLKYKAEQQHEQLDVSERLSFLPLTIKAASKALEQYPLLNASFDSESNQVTMWKDHNIGVAMDTPRGLIVPVLKHCQDKSIPQLTQELQRLKEAAAQGTVDAEDLKGATFSISNIGAIGAGGKFMSPVVTPPQVAIGAIGKIERLPRFVGSTMEVEEAHICAVSWGGDHRVVDGATMARFHTQWKNYMEDPVRLLMEMK